MRIDAAMNESEVIKVNYLTVSYNNVEKIEQREEKYLALEKS